MERWAATNSWVTRRAQDDVIDFPLVWDSPIRSFSVFGNASCAYVGEEEGALRTPDTAVGVVFGGNYESASPPPPKHRGGSLCLSPSVYVVVRTETTRLLVQDIFYSLIQEFFVHPCVSFFSESAFEGWTPCDAQ